MFDPKTAVSPATLGDVMAMRPWGTVGGTIRSYVGDRRVAQMLDHFTQYVGSSPDRSPAVLCGIAHMQTSEGIWYPRGGTRGSRSPSFAWPRIWEWNCEPAWVSSRSSSMDPEVWPGVLTEDNIHVPLAAVVSNADAVRHSSRTAER